VGHPLLDQISNLDTNSVASHIALLPGSRKQELNRLMPDLIEVANSMPGEQFVIAGLHSLKELYPTELPANVKMAWNNTYAVLRHSKAAVVCSGTATLETALLGIPQVVIYKTGWINAQIVKRVAKVNFAALPNLIADEKIVEELLQWDCTPEKIAAELVRLKTTDPAVLYSRMSTRIGGAGASAKAAGIIYALVKFP
jgi:lipid-A-disaccharide synthase